MLVEWLPFYVVRLRMPPSALHSSQNFWRLLLMTDLQMIVFLNAGRYLRGFWGH